MQAQPSVAPLQSLNDLLRAMVLALAIGAAIGGGAMAMAATAHALEEGELDACADLGDPDCRVLGLLLELERLRDLAEGACGDDEAP